MSKYTAEQVFLRSEDVKYSAGIDHRLTPACADDVYDMLRDYAAHLREREAAEAATITGAMLNKAFGAFVHGIKGGDTFDGLRAALEAVAPMLAGATDKHFKHLEQEQDDIDKILLKLGLSVERARTECGYLRVNDILNHIQETLDALAEANSARVAMTDKYVKLASARVPDGYQLVPIEPTREMLEKSVRASMEAESVYDEPRPDGAWEKFGRRINRISHVYKAMLAAAPKRGEG